MIKRAIRAAIRRLGFDVVRYGKKDPGVAYPVDFEPRHVAIVDKVRPYTITSPERVHALIEAVRYIVRNGVQGGFVECGVYKGGSMMAVALALLAEGVRDRPLYLFDTFEGMPKPDEKDVDYVGNPALRKFDERKISEVSSTWSNASLESVREAMRLTGYPLEQVHLVKGLVEETIPAQAPGSIALLRLDTDWYKSTKHELIHLYPRVAPGGILIVDDYGHFRGSRDAVDEYLAENNLAPYLHRIDYTGRLIVKERGARQFSSPSGMTME